MNLTPEQINEAVEAAGLVAETDVPAPDDARSVPDQFPAIDGIIDRLAAEAGSKRARTSQLHRIVTLDVAIEAVREGAAAGVAANEKLTAVLDRLRPIARECGWAIAVHGSLGRDLDLIAAPWTDEATDAETLIDRLCTQADLMVMPNDGATTEPVEYPVEKPRGRRAWALAGCPAPWYYIDLSVVGELPMFRLAAEYRERARGVAASEARAREAAEALRLLSDPDDPPFADWSFIDPAEAREEAMQAFARSALAALLSEEPADG